MPNNTVRHCEVCGGTDEPLAEWLGITTQAGWAKLFTREVWVHPWCVTRENELKIEKEKKWMLTGDLRRLSPTNSTGF